MRFFLVDRIEEISYGRYITGVKCITLADDIFDEHFPGYPVFPGSLILEGVAQLAGSFFELTMEYRQMPQKRCVLSIVNRFKFRRPANPGDRLFYRVDLSTMRDEYGVVKAQAKIGEDLCAEGELTFTFVEIQNQRLHKARADLYRLWMRSAKVIP